MAAKMGLIGAKGGDRSKDGWEKSDFPIVCETCLGNNPFVRMMKAEFDKECKICARPFTVFRWRPGSDARYKKTEVCQVCSKMKNVCQVCLLDLEYGLPVQVRDTAVPGSEAIPQSDVMREWQAEQNANKVAQGLLPINNSFDPTPVILKLARTTPYYKRNRAHICSFFVKGQCNRGTECPYRHEIPEETELSHQNLKDRYHGVNDPVAKKMLARVESMPKLIAPPEQDITTLWVGNVDPLTISEQDIRDLFYAYGELRTIRLAPQVRSAFVTFTTREGAENAAEKLHNKLTIKGVPLRLAWGKPNSDMPYGVGGVSGGSDTFFSLPPPPPAPTVTNTNAYPPPPGLTFYPPAVPPPSAGAASVISRPYYPSMDPLRQGTRPQEKQ